MKRFALLVEASNIKGEEELPGVRQDIDMMNSYLMSLVGGVWSEDEIIL